MTTSDDESRGEQGMAKQRPRPPKPLFEPSWQRYEVANLIGDLIRTWGFHCWERDRLEEGPLGESPSEMFRANHHTPRLETCSKLVDLALKAVGPVSFEGRLFTSSHSIAEALVAADPSVQEAAGLFVEIHSPFNGTSRKA